MAKATTVYQLKVTLNHVKPAIWRRLQVPANIKLDKLHLVLQDSLGWTNSHLHHFMIEGHRFGMIDVDEYDEDLQDETQCKLTDIASEKSRLVYEYDFGDSWEHEVLVEKVLPAEPGVRYPRCLGGKRACPPEDCGGVAGYDNLLAIIANPKHKEYAEMMTWLGGAFDPEAFDVWKTDALLRSSRSKRDWEWARA
jgi:hypothetical protein